MVAIRWIWPVAMLGLAATSGLADEKKIPIEELPRPVVAAAQKEFPEAKIVAAARETEDGETSFEVRMTLEGKTMELELNKDGKIRRVEKEIEADDLPRAVLKSARKKFPEVKIGKVLEVTFMDTVVIYNLEITPKGGKAMELVMSPNGKMVDDDDDKDEKDKDQKDKPKG